jgi:hypothetical protein
MMTQCDEKSNPGCFTKHFDRQMFQDVSNSPAERDEMSRLGHVARRMMRGIVVKWCARTEEEPVAQRNEIERAENFGWEEDPMMLRLVEGTDVGVGERGSCQFAARRS